MWRAMIVYVPTDEQAEKMHTGPPGAPREFHRGDPMDPTRVLLTAEMVDQRMSSVGCFACEQPWSACHDQPCPGDPVGYGPKGEPIYG